MTTPNWALLAESIANKSKHKVFVSYYHDGDQAYKNEFERLFGHLFISKSVNLGDISTDVSTEYVKKLIQQDYLSDASVLVVLIGAKTYCRKHVDWEISAALDKKVGGYSGVIGIILPTHPSFSTQGFDGDLIPARLLDNQQSGYAKVYKWSTNPAHVKTWIDTAFADRVSLSNKITNSRLQMGKNTN